MESLKSNLPRYIQTILEDNTPKALQIQSNIKSKANSITALNNHLAAQSAPRSLLLKTTLIIPDTLKRKSEQIQQNDVANSRFKKILNDFQQQATKEMLCICMRAKESLEEELEEFLQSVDREILEFQYLYLQETSPDEAKIFKEQVINIFPNKVTLDEVNQIPYISEAYYYVQCWRAYYRQALLARIQNNIAKQIAKNKKAQAKTAAEEMVMDDTNNELIRDLIRREVKPIRDTVNHLNKAKAEKANSANKQKRSANSSTKKSAPTSKNEKQEAGKDEKKNKEKEGKEKDKNKQSSRKEKQKNQKKKGNRQRYNNRTNK